MTAYPGTIPVYFAIDQDHDISGAQLVFSLDGGASWPITAAYVSAPSAGLLATPPKVLPRFARYWWQVEAGIGQSMPLVCGPNVFYARLIDGTTIEPHKWNLNLPYFPS